MTMGRTYFKIKGMVTLTELNLEIWKGREGCQERSGSRDEKFVAE